MSRKSARASQDGVATPRLTPMEDGDMIQITEGGDRYIVRCWVIHPWFEGVPV